MKRPDGLTERQARFVEEYLKDLNATQAAVRTGLSAANAKSGGYSIMRKPKVKAAIDAALAARSQRVQVTADDVLRELLAIALSDLAEAYDDNGELLPLRKIPKPLRQAIATLDTNDTVTDDGTKLNRRVNIRLWDKNKALENLAKHLGLLTDKVEHTVRAPFGLKLVRKGG